MAGIDLVDETFIAAPAASLAPIVADPQRWHQWWPDLALTVFMDRGDAGQRWSMTGALIGSCEIWLEPVADGTLVHYYLRGEPAAADGRSPQPFPDDHRGWRAADRVRRRRALAWKRQIWALKDEVEGGRRPGEPAAGTTEAKPARSA